jgi:hypothetical protein
MGISVCSSGLMKAWWNTFSPRSNCVCSPCSRTDRPSDRPLQTEGRTARLIGSSDVCDHLDLVVAADKKKEFCEFLMNRLKSEGVDHLDLGPVRPDSVVMTALLPMAREKGLPATAVAEDVLFELPLPASWDGYLALLSGKQRHEIRRKLRRLEESKAHAFRMLDEPGGVRRESTTSSCSSGRTGRIRPSSCLNGWSLLSVAGVLCARNADRISGR